MKFGIITLLALTVFMVGEADSQPNIALLSLFDAGQQEGFNDVYHTADGGFVACGMSVPIGANFYDGGSGSAYVVRMDEHANTIWSRVYEEQGRSFITYTIIETDQGDFVTGGYHAGQFGVMKINRDGEMIWRRDYTTGTCQAVLELKDGDYMLTGGNHGQLIRINSDGDAVWARDYQDINGRFFCLREAADGIIAAGNGVSGGDRGVWAMKASIDNGEQTWSDVYGEDYFTKTYSIVSTSDGGFALAGTAEDNGNQFLLLKINTNGDLLWSKIYYDLSRQPSEAFSVARIRDGGFILVGLTEMGARPGAVRTGSDGQENWHQIFTFQGDFRLSTPSRFTSVITDAHDQIVACGWVKNHSVFDGLIVRLEPDEPQASNITISPEDTLMTILPDTTIAFSVTVSLQSAEELQYLWMRGDSVVGHDSLCSLEFDSLGEELVECRIIYDQLVVPIRWHVIVRDFFIASYTPDTLNLACHRGSTVNFSIDSIAAMQGDPVNYAWTMRDLGGGQQEDEGTDSSATVEFRRSGDYTLEGYVYRGESSDGVTWNIAVRSCVLDFRPEQQTLTVPLDTTITFGIIPFDPADTLRYLWLVDGDSVGRDSSVSMQFTEETGQAGRLPYAVTAIVSDSSDSDTIVWNVTVVRPNSIAPPVFHLSSFSFQLSPNPFNSRSTVHFSLPVAASGTLTLHDLTGRTVRSLAEGRFIAGEHQVVLDAAELPAGLYFLRLEVSGKVKIAKAVVIK